MFRSGISYTGKIALWFLLSTLDSVLFQGVSPHAMPLLDRGLAVRVFHASVALVLAVTLYTLSSPVAILDRRKWEYPPASPPQVSSKRTLTGGCLRRLVHECSRRPNLEDLRCDDHDGVQDEFGTPTVDIRTACGFEVRRPRSPLAL